MSEILIKKMENIEHAIRTLYNSNVITCKMDEDIRLMKHSNIAENRIVFWFIQHAGTAMIDINITTYGDLELLIKSTKNIIVFAMYKDNILRVTKQTALMVLALNQFP